MTDALLLARHADHAVLVVQHNKVDKKLVKRSVAALRKATPNLLGAVLNVVDVRARSYQYYYYPQQEGGSGGRSRPSAGEAPAAKPETPAAGDVTGGARPRAGPRPRRPRRRRRPARDTRTAAPPRRRHRDRRTSRGRTGTWSAPSCRRRASWRRLGAGDKLRTGDTFRTAGDATARLEFPWMEVTLGPGSDAHHPREHRAVDRARAGPGRVRRAGPRHREDPRRRRRGARRRATRPAPVGGAHERRRARGSLPRARPRPHRRDQGRAGHRGDGRPPARGARRPFPRRREASTRDRTPPTCAPASRWSCAGRRPARRTTWRSSRSQEDAVLLAREAGAPPLRLEIPWLGTYRWRVAARDARGVESRPSAEGLICSVDR